MPEPSVAAEIAAPPTVRQALAATARSLAKGGVPAPALDARLLLGAALGASHEDMARSPGVRLDGGAAARLCDFVQRRLDGEPAARILGHKEFWGLEFAVNESVLVPRPDSETLVQAVLDRLRKQQHRPLRLADLGTGSGCLIVALLTELTGAVAVATDTAAAALALARANAARHRVAGRLLTVCCDWAEALGEGYDAILANPPYIRTREIETLSRDVALFDPRPALDGGLDGLAAYRSIVPQAYRRLVPGGLLAMEIGAGQENAVLDIAAAAGFEPHGDAALSADLSARWRVVSISKPLMS